MFHDTPSRDFLNGVIRMRACYSAQHGAPAIEFTHDYLGGVILLHWTEFRARLSEQSGGASAVRRRLVEEARGKSPTGRECRDAAYRVMQAACGDMPGYEAVLRAIFSPRGDAFHALVERWPDDIV